ncbi:MAG: fasciclin domain-containing protein, partial [Verrucomicrobiales bacterium]|nr:fasciclin domain-containing protein [Verrucomicrobiales bacterium]
MSFKVACYLFLVTALGVAWPSDLRAADPAEAKTIGRVVREREDLSKFLLLLDKTELGSLLSEKTDIRRTVFAPTDAAFAKLQEGALETLLDPRNDDRLEEVFGFHVITRSASKFALEKNALLRMNTGQFLSINSKEGVIGDAKFTGETIRCSNGIIHLIDTVLTPNTDDLFQRLQKDGRFTIFTKAITASRQGKLFQNMHRNYTAFAPTDAAFGKLPAEFVESLSRPENDERLEDIIKHHITDGVFAVGKIPGYLSLGVS